MPNTKKVYISASIKGKSTTALEDGDTFINTFTGTGSSNSEDLAQAIKFAFISLTSPLIQNIDVYLNDSVTYKVKTVIEVTITLTVNLPDPDGDNARIKIPLTFSATSADLINNKLISFGPTQVVGYTSTSKLTSTSASILAELGILNLVLEELIPQLIYEITGVSNAGLGNSYCEQSSSDSCTVNCYNSSSGSSIYSIC